MDRAVDGVLGEALKHRLQEIREFGLAHLATAHGKIAMTNATEATDVAVDHDIVWRVRGHEIHPLAFTPALLSGRGARIFAGQTGGSPRPQSSRRASGPG